MFSNVILIVFFTLFLFFLSLSLLMMGVIYYNKKSEKDIIKKLNELSSYDFDQKIERLSIITDHQEKYETVLNMMFSFKEFSKEFIFNLKKLSFKLINYNNTYDFFSAFFVAKKINKDCKYLKQKIDEFDEILFSMYKNVNIVSELYMEDVRAYNRIADFYEKNLSNDYDNTQIYLLFEESKLLLKQLFEQKYKCEIQNVIDIHRRLVKSLNELSKILSKIFIYNQIILYIRFNLKEISKLVISGKINISNQDSKIIERNKSILEDLYNSLLSSVKSMNFSSVKTIIKEASKYISIINEKMNYSIKYDSLLIDKAKKTLSLFLEKENELVNYLRKVLQNFSTDNEIKNSIMTCFDSLNKVIAISKSINNDNSKNMSGKEKISKILECDVYIKTFITEMYDMNYNISQKYSIFGKLIVDISTYKTTLANLYKMVLETGKNSDTLREIQERVSLLSKIEERISNDKSYIESEELSEKIIQIKDWTISNTMTFIDKYKIKRSAEKLLVLSYRLLGKNNNDDELIIKAEQLYKKNEYKKSIDILEKKLKIFKKIKETSYA